MERRVVSDVDNADDCVLLYDHVVAQRDEQAGRSQNRRHSLCLQDGLRTKRTVDTKTSFTGDHGSHEGRCKGDAIQKNNMVLYTKAVERTKPEER